MHKDWGWARKTLEERSVVVLWVNGQRLGGQGLLRGRVRR